ncbi:LysR family transcriptional regulator [Paracoccus sp. DMF-8]|uniref:LysR family transcriptional regulator n=1 Tax=Paracoccus sp. DMF-8 TaxID=3019445 RepID=UPI0023E7C7E2|nr:LysR family transcriptional regulator [Paracoccus sp. DMF-8]MDF3606261.1 LysR family transcriptional regulator [Paracoccus sp. DMF-8]
MSKPAARLMLKPAWLALVREIADQGQLQSAAVTLGMTQPAASRMLGEIERQVGGPLFLRQPKGMEPTETCRTVLRRARVILREMTSMATDLQNLHSGFAGSVRVGAVTGPAVRLLVRAVRDIKQQAPDADITIDAMPSRDLLTLLTAGELDLAIGRILPEFDVQAFNILPMSDEKVSLLVRGQHPLARSPSVTLTELHGYEWIIQQRGAPIREATLSAFAGLGLTEPANVINSPSVLLTLAYIAGSDAVAPLSDEVAQLLIRPPIGAGFVILRIPHDIRVPPYYLLDLRRRPLTPLALRLRERLIALSRA